MKFKIILVLSVLGISIFCGATQKSDGLQCIDKDDQEKLQRSNTSCLADLIEGNEIEKLISKKKIEMICKVSTSALNYEVNKSSNARYSSVDFSWEPEKERVMLMETKVGDRMISQRIPLKNTIEIGNLQRLSTEEKSPIAYFEYAYGPKTKEDKEKAKQKIDASEKASEKVDKHSAEIIKKMVDEQNAILVEGVGDKAYWNEYEVKGAKYLALRVLHADTMFKVTVDISEDTLEDLRIAKEVAVAILNNCN